MFRRFAYQFSGFGDDEEWGQGWTPPWQRGGHHGPHHHGPHGPWQAHLWGGPGGPGPFDQRGPFGGGPRRGFGPGERFFGRGDVKFALLLLLQERPMYGYEMIKALEGKSGCFYNPTPGSTYPALQMLA